VVRLTLAGLVQHLVLFLLRVVEGVHNTIQVLRVLVVLAAAVQELVVLSEAKAQPIKAMLGVQVFIAVVFFILAVVVVQGLLV